MSAVPVAGVNVGGNYAAVQPQACGRGVTMPAGLGGFAGEDGWRRGSLPGSGNRVVPPVPLTAARFALLFDVTDFAAGRDLSITADEAAAPESRKAEKPNKTHRNQSSRR